MCRPHDAAERLRVLEEEKATLKQQKRHLKVLWHQAVERVAALQQQRQVSG